MTYLHLLLSSSCHCIPSRWQEKQQSCESWDGSSFFPGGLAWREQRFIGFVPLLCQKIGHSRGSAAGLWESIIFWFWERRSVFAWSECFLLEAGWRAWHPVSIGHLCNRCPPKKGKNVSTPDAVFFLEHCTRSTPSHAGICGLYTNSLAVFQKEHCPF